MKRLSLLLLCSCLLTSFAAAPAAAQVAGADLEKLSESLRFLRERNAREYAVTGPDAIDEGRYVTVGGIEQWITIRGEDRRNPVLLFLHGGPGDATNPWGWAVFRTWLKAFTVVQWDQRGTGRTLAKSGPSVAPTITVECMTHDGIELSELLCRTLHKEKVILVGHSWGSVLGILMTKKRPDLFWAYVGTGQVAAEASRATAVAYEGLLAKAAKVGDAHALRELKEIGPPPWKDGKGFGVQWKWAKLFEGADSFLASMLGFALVAPGYKPGDISDWWDGQSLTGERVMPEARALGAKELGGEFAVPVFVIQGAEDLTTPTSLAKSFVDSVKAPRKDFVAIPDAGHFAVFTKRDAFLHELVVRVLPAIGPRGASPRR